MRRDPPLAPGERRLRGTKIVLLSSPGRDHVLLSRANATELPRIVRTLIRRAARRGSELEWKLYEHDPPAGMAELLRHAGFHPEPSETLMVLPLDGPPIRAPRRRGLTTRRVVDRPGLLDATAVTKRAFGRDESSALTHLERRLEDPTVAVFVADLDGIPVATGRIELPDGRSFAGLWGGGTSPDFRRRGAYRALVARRAAYARERGYRYLTVEARDSTSRPILERLGFVALTRVVGWVRSPARIQRSATQ